MVTDHLQNRVTGRKRSNEGDRKDALAWPPETLKAICQSSLRSSLQALQFVPQHHGHLHTVSFPHEICLMHKLSTCIPSFNHSFLSPRPRKFSAAGCYIWCQKPFVPINASHFCTFFIPLAFALHYALTLIHYPRTIFIFLSFPFISFVSSIFINLYYHSFFPPFVRLYLLLLTLPLALEFYILKQNTDNLDFQTKKTFLFLIVLRFTKNARHI